MATRDVVQSYYDSLGQKKTSGKISTPMTLCFLMLPKPSTQKGKLPSFYRLYRF